MMARLASDKRGLALVEFAFSVPVLIVLFIGSFQLSDAISAYRKVTTTTRAIGDLTSQYSSVADSDLDSILAASQQIMSPYSYTNAQLTITQVAIDSSGNAKVDWSRALNNGSAGPGLTSGTSITLPSNLRTPNTYVLLAQTTFQYTPTAASPIIGNIPMRDQLVFVPRVAAKVTHT